MVQKPPIAAGPVCLPDAPTLVVGVRTGIWLEAGSEPERIHLAMAANRISAGVCPLICHAKAVARRIGTPPFRGFDVLELFAFVRPARFCVPTVPGLAEALLLARPTDIEGEALALRSAARALLAELRASPGADALGIAWSMFEAGWAWGQAVLSALNSPEHPSERDLGRGLRVWTRLKEWHDTPSPPPPDSWPVEPVEARARLVQMLGAKAEPRPQQTHYATDVSSAFAPRERAGEPQVVLAEAGTGVGKTLGYLAPASIWAEKNRAPVWVSTFTRNLQRQIDGELDHLFPELGRKRAKVVVRKGRENIVCLLNVEEVLATRGGRGSVATVALGLVARWITATRDGDMIGGDFPSWLTDLLGSATTVDLTDTRGECIHSACNHYRRCFIEKQVRRARNAQIVVANHALVMIQAAIGGDEAQLPTRYIFDEGHHLFDAADSAFSANLSGREVSELRRWLMGSEDRRRARSRGLALRVGDLIGENSSAVKALDAALVAARALPGPGWRRRISEDGPIGPAEVFLSLIRQQVYARDPTDEHGYSLECYVQPPLGGLVAAAERLEQALRHLAEPLQSLVHALAALLDDKASKLDSSARQRIDATLRGLDRRALRPISAWRAMLTTIDGDVPDSFVDWLGVDRFDGRDLDVGLHRHWRDPTEPFMTAVAGHAHGFVITSATLKDDTGDPSKDWAAAEMRTGARHLPTPPKTSSLASPFDHANRTRVIIVDDLQRNSPDRIAAAFRVLFEASGGGALGLFTAIQRLRAVHQRIAAPLDAAGLRLYAQHVDVLDAGTLVDIFRADEDACLLGTDAIRDGVDVPGRSLRLIVFDRVPWPRPTILHRARRDAFGSRAYDEQLVRWKLKQAYGRLIRRSSDKGVFVVLDRALPSRFLTAFPADVLIERLGLADTVAKTRRFLSTDPASMSSDSGISDAAARAP